MKLTITPALKRSHWLQQCNYQNDQIQIPNSLVEAEITIIGGGFVGLWTALTIIKQEPDARVVILEQDICGGGASGRNGGFVMSWWPKISTLQSFCSKQEALFLAENAEQAISEIGEFCRSHTIEAHFQQQGWLWTATTPAHIDSWRNTIAACEKLGVTPFELLSPSEVAKRTGSKVHLAGVFEKSNATVQPAALARGMRKIALEAGIKIYEQCGVKEIVPGQTVTLKTNLATVQAKQVVLATNAWAACIPKLAKLIVPVNSSIIVTETMPEKLQTIGWTRGESITDSQLLVNYYRSTHDGRIAFGKGTGAIEYGSKIGQIFSDDAGCIALTEQNFRATYPMLTNIKIADTWSGPIDRTYDSLPVFGQLSEYHNIHYGIGWSGNGVGPSKIGGKILASLTLNKQDQWSNCALVNRNCRKFPPEPIRYIGGNMVRNAVIKKETAEMSGQKPCWFNSYLAKFAPSGLEDKS